MLSDLRFAFRSLAKSPGFAAVVLLTLALGIGVNTSMYTLVDVLFFRTVPVRDVFVNADDFEHVAAIIEDGKHERTNPLQAQRRFIAPETS